MGIRFGQPNRWERLATFGFFILMGTGTSAWFSRLPSIKEMLGLQPSSLGLITILGGCGALVGMVVSGVLTNRLGVRRSMLLAVSTWCLGMLVVSVAIWKLSIPVVVLGLFLNSAGISLWGTVNTVEAGAVERGAQRSIMAWFHASYSLGMFLALGLGSFISHLNIPVIIHLSVNALITLVLMISCLLVCPSAPLGDNTGTPNGGSSGKSPDIRSLMRKQVAAWGDSLVLMLALINVALEASEGAVNDWSSIGIVESFKVPESLAGLAPTIFAATMIISRLAGPWVIEYLGRMASLYMTLLVSATGILVYSLSPLLIVSLIGAGLWGIGAALGVPIITTLATRDPAMAAQRASVISTAYYGVSWIIPPAIGFLADHTGVRPALLPLALILVLVTLMVRPVVRHS